MECYIKEVIEQQHIVFVVIVIEKDNVDRFEAQQLVDHSKDLGVPVDEPIEVLRRSRIEKKPAYCLS